MEQQILQILENNPNLSNRGIGEILGISRNTVLYYLNKLNIHRDRKTMQSLNNTCRETKVTITEVAELLILGSILGDGYISKYRRPANTKLLLNSQLIINHSIKLKEYIIYLLHLFMNEGLQTHLKFYNYQKKHFIKGNLVEENGTYTLRILRNVVFNRYRDMFYSSKKKVNRYLFKLSALGLAIWYMDDGYKTGKTYSLCTNGFTFKDVLFLQELLKHNFNIDTTIHKSNLGLPILYIRTISSEIFRNLICPYICDSMKYKL